MEEDAFDLDPTDLFLGLPGSPRKTEENLEQDSKNYADVPPHAKKKNARSAPHMGKILACARLSRKDSEESFGEEYRVHSPLVRRSKSLLLRRAASELLNASPLGHYLSSDPVPVKRRRLPFSEKPLPGKGSPKPRTLERVQSEDCLDNGESGASSGCESASIETDDEAPSRLESLKSEEQSSEKAGGKADNLDDSVSIVMNVPFRKLAMRQDSELFEEPSQQKEPMPFFNSFLFMEENVPEIALEDYPTDHEHRIKSAVERLNTRAVIGDGTVPYALPCIPGIHGGHKYITVDTLAQLINGEFTDTVRHFVVIDCRYPYEYSGGHVKGATNMYCGESVDEILSWRGKDDDSDTRTVLIFHCEFSSQRAPTMMRLLRSADRQRNSHCYPYLCYPEIYLLSGGYKLFFQKYPDLCEPRSYTPMNHRDYQSDLKLFRSKATTWHGEVKLKKHANSLIF